MDFPTVILQRIGTKSPQTLCCYLPGIQIFYLSLAGNLRKVYEFWSIRKCVEKGDAKEVVTSKNSEKKVLKEEGQCIQDIENYTALFASF